MKVLYYIRQLRNNDLLSDYVRRLAASLEGAAEVHVATYENKIQEVLDEYNPDVIHIHGCWDRYAYRLMNTAVKQGFAVVLSPHGEIGTYAMKHEHCLSKSVAIVDYQRWMIWQSDALLVTSEEEKDRVAELGWQKRIDVIKASLLDSSISDEEMVGQFLWFYGKVLDTRYRIKMSESEHEAIRSLLHVGMAHDETMPLLDSERLLTLRGLKPDQWRRILLYADDEDIRYIIDAAAERLQLSIPAIDTSAISRYATEKPKAMGELPKDRVIGGNKLRAKKLRDITEDDSDDLKEITVMLENARLLLRKGQMSIRHLAELYDAIKYIDYDESRLVDIVKEARMRGFMRSLLQVLADEIYLEEGFMPDEPANNKLTRKIKKQLRIT